MNTKDLRIAVRLSKDGEYIDTEHCNVTVDKSVDNDDCRALFDALYEQCPELYDDNPDCELEISEVEEV